MAREARGPWILSWMRADAWPERRHDDCFNFAETKQNGSTASAVW
jgi:hypothetical protein